MSSETRVRFHVAIRVPGVYTAVSEYGQRGHIVAGKKVTPSTYAVLLCIGLQVL